MSTRCEIVLVRCNESTTSLVRLANRTGQRLSILEKCGRHEAASALHLRNVGEEGFGYLSWIIARWDTLPPCAWLLHGGSERRGRFWSMCVAPSPQTVPSAS